MKYAILGTILVLLALAGLYSFRMQTPATSAPESPDIRFGFVRAVTNDDGYMLAFDKAQWLTGKEGQDAAIAAGICTESTRSECLPNDFFIQNDATTTEPLALADDAEVAMFTLHMESNGVKEESISVADFAMLINDSKQHWSQLPYQMVVEDGKVTILEEVYVP